MSGSATNAFYGSRLRHESYDEIVFSPHLDDAVYSLAGTMLAASAARRRVLVVTVFGHGAASAPSGRGTFDDYASRELEDRGAMLALDVDYIWLNLPELIFRGSRGSARLAEILPHASFEGTVILDQVTLALRGVVERYADSSGAVTIHVPLAIGAHPDHRLVHEAGRSLAPARQVRFYEDVPYALEPALVEARLSVLRGSSGPRVVAVARGLARLAFRGVARLFAVAPLIAYVAIAEFVRWRRRGGADSHAALAVADDQDIGAHVVRKAHAMWLYRSQTPLFFSDEAAIASALPRNAHSFIERSWRLCP